MLYWRRIGADGIGMIGSLPGKIGAGYESPLRVVTAWVDAKRALIA